MHRCLVCKKYYEEKPCHLQPKECLSCVAKNICKNRNPKDPQADPVHARWKRFNDLWDARRCR